MTPTQRKNPNTSVYPSAVAKAILGGYRSKWLNRSIECWAYLLGKASDQVEGLLLPGEWELIAKAFRLVGPKLDTGAADPASSIIIRTLDEANLGSVLFKHKEVQRDLVERLARLDYLRAWAVIYAVQWAIDTGHDADADADDQEWWTVAFRSQHGQTKGEDS